MPLPAPVLRIRLAFHRRRSRYWFVSFPKSGRTWSKTVVERYLAVSNGLPPFTFEQFTPWHRSGPWRRVPRLVYVHPHCRETDPQPTERFVRKLSRRKVLVMVRDPRAVVFTYYFRLRKRMQDPRALSLTLASFIRDEEFGITRIVDFTNTWYRAEGRFADFLFLRLEDLQTEPLVHFSRFLSFLDIPVDRDLLSEVIASTADTTTRQIEDPAVTLTDADRAFMEAAVAGLDPEIGYQVDRCQAEYRDGPVPPEG